MVNAPNSVGYQVYNTQPAVVESPVKTEAAQPRQAPAADSQRGDQKPFASKEEATPQKGKSDGRVDIKV